MRPSKIPTYIQEQVRALCLALPEVTVRVDQSRTAARSTAYSFDIRSRSFCLLVATGDPTGKPIPLLTTDMDWEEIRQLVTESYRGPRA